MTPHTLPQSNYPILGGLICSVVVPETYLTCQESRLGVLMFQYISTRARCGAASATSREKTAAVVASKLSDSAMRELLKEPEIVEA